MKELRFVYADDEETLHFVTEIYLQRTFGSAETKVSVAHVNDGKELVDYVNANPVDGIVTDFNMPQKTGLEALLELRQAGKNIKALVVTGKPVPEQTRPMDEANIPYIAKPYNGAELKAKLYSIWPEYVPQPQASTDDQTFPRSA